MSFINNDFMLKNERRNYMAMLKTMQLHIGALRNNNTRMYEKLGADTGSDSVNDFEIAREISKLLNELDKVNMLPKTI